MVVLSIKTSTGTGLTSPELSERPGQVNQAVVGKLSVEPDLADEVADSSIERSFVVTNL